MAAWIWSNRHGVVQTWLGALLRAGADDSGAKKQRNEDQALARQEKEMKTEEISQEMSNQ